MKSLLRDMKFYIREVILAPALKMCEALMDLFVPLVMKKIIDTGIPNGDRVYILKMCLLLIALPFLGLAFSATAQYFSARAAVGFCQRLRQKVFDHIQKLSFTQTDTTGTSTIITRMTSDINQIQNGVNLTLRLFLRSPFIVFGSMIMAFTVDVKAALVFVVVIPLLMIVVFGIMLGTVPLYKKVQNGLDKITGRTRENLSGVRVIRAFALENSEEEGFVSDNAVLKGLQVFAGRISAFLNPVTYIFINLAVVALIYSGAVRVSVGLLTQGAVIALVNYMNQVLAELIKLADLIIKMTRAWACGNRVAEILNEEDPREAATLNDKKESPDAESVPGSPVVDFSHVSMGYTGAEEALTDISVRAEKGETIGIIGGTGSGKSSLVSLIPAFYPYSAGSLKVNGTEVSDWDLTDLRRRIGIVLQKAVLFSGTIRDNLLWGDPEATDEELEEALKTAQAWDFVSVKGLDAEVEQDGRNFSGGQKQRLSIARALVRKPEILILDDSSSALDFATDASLREAIGKAHPDMTVFIVSQRAASVMNADRILVLDDGRAAGLGTHEELLQSCDVYREIYESQFG